MTSTILDPGAGSVTNSLGKVEGDLLLVKHTSMSLKFS